MEKLMPIFRELILVAAILLMTWGVLQTKKVFHRKMQERRTSGRHALDPLSTQILERVFTILILFISAMLVLQVFGLDIVPLLTFSGIGAAAVGFASRDVVANFFGGLMIFMTRPFVIGDSIEIPDKKISGTVEDIGWYLTTIRDAHKTSLYLPNSIFPTEMLVNHSRLTHRRMEEKIRVKAPDLEKAQKVVEEIRQVVQNEPLVDRSQPVEIFLQKISPWGVLEIGLNTYLSTTDNEKFLETKQRLLLQIYKKVHAVEGRT
jgi:MscS family membrane protein